MSKKILKSWSYRSWQPGPSDKIEGPPSHETNDAPPPSPPPPPPPPQKKKKKKKKEQESYFTSNIRTLGAGVPNSRVSRSAQPQSLPGVPKCPRSAQPQILPGVLWSAQRPTPESPECPAPECPWSAQPQSIQSISTKRRWPTDHSRTLSPEKFQYFMFMQAAPLDTRRSSWVCIRDKMLVANPEMLAKEILK